MAACAAELARVPLALLAVLAVAGSAGASAHGLTEKEILAGWIALFDGDSTFGFVGGKLEKHNGKIILRGGKTTTEFSDCVIKAQVSRGGVIKVGGADFVVSPGTATLQAHHGRGRIDLGNDVAVASLVLRPLGLEPLFNGRNLEDWQVKFNPKLPAEKRAHWSVEDGAIRARGGPGALEYAGKSRTLYGDLIAQLTVRTRREHTNGGFFFRNQPDTVMMGYEAQIHNKLYNPLPLSPRGRGVRGPGEHGWSTGAIDDRQHARRLNAKDGSPFVMTVIAHGPHIATWVNGHQTTDWTDTREADDNPRRGLRLAAGTIQLQAHDPETDIDFQAIRIREMPRPSPLSPSPPGGEGQG